jgi:predicted DCC family thiol-disulfide oxidoreductase YuxK
MTVAMASSDPFGGVQPIDFGGPSPLPRSSSRTAVGGPRLVVLYDRDCGLCTATARTLRRWDRRGRLELLPLQDADVSDRPKLAETVRGLPLTAALHVVDEATGRVRAGGDAVLSIGAALPGGRVAGLLGAIPPVRWVVGLGYDAIARNRHWIGRWLRLEGPACDVPPRGSS